MSAAYRVDLNPCFVLHQRPWRESSLIVEVFSAHSGRLGLVARGARRPASPLRGLLQPFVPLLVSWLDRGELGTLRAAEPDGPVLPLTGEGAGGRPLPERAPHAPDAPSRSSASPSCWRITGRRCSVFTVARTWSPCFAVFEKRLLSAIGYGLLLDREGAEAIARCASIARTGTCRSSVRSREGRSRHPVSTSRAPPCWPSPKSASNPRKSSRRRRGSCATCSKGLLGPRPLGTRMLFRTQTRR